mmetsp:Transcript_9590/g.13085  ORF Transcript_9590/g.13085 Transcript_9590/m.13085 type:complete len:129 (+) Transcript_9590:96-482(+)
MEKHRLWRETRSQVSLIVRTKLLFITDKGGDDLRQCMSDFYMELVRDIELLSSLKVERDSSVFKYVLDKLRNERSCQAVQLQALVLAAQIEEDTASHESDVDEEMLDYVDPFVVGHVDDNTYHIEAES